MIDDAQIDELLRLLPEPSPEWIHAATEIPWLEVPDVDAGPDGLSEDQDFDGQADDWSVEPDPFDSGDGYHHDPDDSDPGDGDGDFGDGLS